MFHRDESKRNSKDIIYLLKKYREIELALFQKYISIV